VLTNLRFTAVPLNTNFNPTCGLVYTYRWNFGDGVSTTSTTEVVDHSYALPGTYVVTLHISRSDGFDGTVSRGIAIAAGLAALDWWTLMLLAAALSVTGYAALSRT
jgi:PKD repeat protein